MKKLLTTVALALAIVLAAFSAQAQTKTQTANWVVTWQDKSTNETGFDIEMCAGAGCATFAKVGAVGANVVTFSYVDAADPGLVTRSFRVRATNADGASAYSNVATATSPRIVLPPDGIPTGVVVTVTVSATSGP